MFPWWFSSPDKPQPLPPTAIFPGDHDRFFQANLEQRLDHFSKLAQRASKGTLVHTSKSGHFIHATEPELVVWAIERVLSTQRHIRRSSASSANTFWRRRSRSR